MIHQWLKLKSVDIIRRVYKAILFKLNKIQGSRDHQIKVTVIQGFQGLLDTLSQFQEINFDRTLITQIRPLNKCTCFFLLPGKVLAPKDKLVIKKRRHRLNQCLFELYCWNFKEILLCVRNLELPKYNTL